MLTWQYSHTVCSCDGAGDSLKSSPCVVNSRGGVLEDTFWSPWPWSLKSAKIALPSARGQHYFWAVEISTENARNLAENLQKPFFWFPQVEIAWKKIFEDLFHLKKNFEDIFFVRSPEKKFWTPFFLGEHLRLCPWSLALASRGSVLGLEIFLCPWPPALCPRLHLW